MYHNCTEKSLFIERIVIHQLNAKNNVQESLGKPKLNVLNSYIFFCNKKCPQMNVKTCMANNKRHIKERV